LQEEHFEQIAHRFGVADDVVPDRLLAEGIEQAWRCLEDLELFFGSFGIDDTGNAQRPRITQESDKKSLLRWFVKTGIVRRHARALEERGERLFMPVRALPEIDSGKMKAEDIDSPAQGREPRRDQGLAMMRGKRKPR